MDVMSKSTRDIMARLGFDVLDHLDAMRDRGIQNIEIDERTFASSSALRVWEDSNYPYRLPEDLRAFLEASDGFLLSWSVKHHGSPGGGRGGRGGEVTVGRICVGRLASITRVPLDADDLSDMASSRARAAAVAAVDVARTGSLLRRPSSSPPASGDGSDHARERGGDIRGQVAPARRGVANVPSPSVGANGDGGAYGIAAFSLDSSCEVGKVALVYGGAPARSDAKRRGVSRKSREAGVKGVVVELASPEVWLQDLSCRWHFLADSFTSYFRMMLVHLGVLGWQQAFTPVGLSPSTEQCMRLFCPDRLLFDQLEWQKERANAKATSEAPGWSRRTDGPVGVSTGT